MTGTTPMAVEQSSTRAGRGEFEKYHRRYLWLLTICLISFVALGLRLWHLQIVEGEEYHRVSTQNIIRQVEIKAPRGEILDRYGVALAKNRPSFDVVVDPAIFLANADETVIDMVKEFLHLTDRDWTRVHDRLKARRGDVVVRRNAARSDVARIEEHQMQLPGVNVRINHQRHYPLHHVGAHGLGYISEVGPNQLRRMQPYGYRRGDFVGQMGLERSFEGVLHGSPGLERKVVDARGNRLGEAETDFLIGEYQQIAPIAGRDLVTTLDADLMVIIDEAIRDYPAGAVVAVDPRDGSVLATYSKPHFNPNAWSGQLSSMEMVRSDNDPFRPMVDKAMSGFFPGSVFKFIGTLAALTEGGYSAHDEVHCPGHYMLGGHRFGCWRAGGHGRVNAYTAMAQSCNVYYYNIAERVGIDPVAKQARALGLGERTGIQLPGEGAGRIVDSDWYDENNPDGYQRGFALNAIIGQGDTLVTPLQLVMAYAAIANGGKLYYPRLVDEIRTQTGDSLFEFHPTIRKRVSFDEEHLEILRESLRMVLHSGVGTARRSSLSHTEAAGKTGTAQVAQIGAVRIPHAERELHLRNHAWFAAYAPFDEPEIALVVFLEHGGGGGGDAAPVAMEILDRYLTREERSALSVRLGDEMAQGNQR